MYGKALRPGPDIDVPLLTITTAPGSVLADQLHKLGWPRYQGEPVGADGEVRIGHDHLTVTVGGEDVLVDDANPTSPEGWWEAVDRLKGHSLVIFVPAGTPIGTPEFADRLERLAGSPGTAQALLPVRHD